MLALAALAQVFPFLPSSFFFYFPNPVLFSSDLVALCGSELGCIGTAYAELYAFMHSGIEDDDCRFWFYVLRNAKGVGQWGRKIYTYMGDQLAFGLGGLITSHRSYWLELC